MYVNIAVLKETRPHERRVALVPAVVPRLTKLGARLHMPRGAAGSLGLPEAAFADVVLVSDRRQLVGDADVVLAIQPPALDVIHARKRGATLISFIYADQEPALVQALLDRHITCFAMERVPRITRAQAMDALSSQAALAGYYAVVLGATQLGRILPKVTTAAGAIGPATVLVMGLGGAGLEALATAHRLGAVVEGYDVRPETAEQARSLGATFVDTGVDARGEGGYARELTPDEHATVAAAVTSHIQHADLIITAAAVPGKPSPKLVSHAQLAGMKPGAVIVALSAEGGAHASRLGAEVVVNAKTSADPVAAGRKATGGGAHGVLITAPSLGAFQQGVAMTREHGTCVLVGLPPGTFPVPLFDVVATCITIRGSFVGTRADMAEALAFAAEGKVKADIELQPLDAINAVFDRLQHGDVPSRVVLEFAGAA